MAVKKGFKLTEVGEIPEDWEVRCLGEISDKVGSGITPTGGEKVYKSSGRPFVRSQNVGWGLLLLDDLAYIDEKTHSSFNSTEIKIYDILLNITGASIGRSAVANAQIAQGNVNQHVCIIRLKEGIAVPEYICEYILSDAGQRQINNFQAGGNRQGLNFHQVRSINIPFPSYTEQSTIAAALSDIDTLITSLERLIAKKRLIKQGAMRELLTGKRRLPGYVANYKLTELGTIPEDWGIAPLGQVALILRGSSPRPIEQYLTKNHNGHNWIKIGDVNPTAKYIITTEAKITNEGAIHSRPVHKGDFLLSNSMSFGRPYVLQIDGCIHDGWLVIQNYNKYFYTDFLYYLLCSELILKQYISKAAGSGVLNLNKELVASVLVCYPSYSEQKAIAAVLSDMDSEISALESKLEKTRQIKAGMMNELLTGRIRLS